MRVLVTGANGFLGRHVVASLVKRGHRVAALVRPARQIAPEFFPPGVDIVRGDLRSRTSLGNALANVDAVVHLAACVVGDDDSQFASTVVGTENLLEAMVAQGVKHLVHCSTFSVYDWKRATSPLDEYSPLEQHLYERDGYAISKTWQERLVRRYSGDHRWQLTVIRPGFIWGRGNEEVSGVGHSFGPLHLVFGGMRSLPLTYVENCAECFAVALDSPKTVGKTINVIDTDRVSAWRYQKDYLRATGRRGVRIYVPNIVGIGTAFLATAVSRWLYRGKGKLPGILMPIRFRSRFRPIKFSDQQLRETLPHRKPIGYGDAWKRVVARQSPSQVPSQPAQPAPTPAEAT